MHVSTVTWQVLARFGHEAGCNAKLAGDRFDGKPMTVLAEVGLGRVCVSLEKSSSVCHASDLAKLESGLEDTRTTLGMPSLDVASELFACFVDTIVVILVVYRSGNAVPKHAFGEGG